MEVLNMEQLPDEIRMRIKSIISELITIQEALKVTEERNRELRDSLTKTLTDIGVETGSALDASRMGFRVRVAQNTNQKLDRPTLERLGVSQDILDQATLSRQTKPYIRLEPLRS